ncbi:O-antigen ligase family protein [Candidatus Aerophobetes bacterium]|nr:O-antigen ligase family protein [Candidatus Aerophobetes bacterium]
MLGIFLLFLPLFPPLSYFTLLVCIAKKIKELNLKKFLHTDFLLFDLILLSLFIAILVSALLSPYRIHSLTAFPLFCFYLIVHFLMRDATKRNGEKYFLNLIFLSLFFLCGFGIIQYLLNLNVSFHKSISHLRLSTRGGITSLLGNQNKFADFLILTLPLILTSISWKRINEKRQLFLLFLLFLGLVCLVLTGSLGGMGAVGIVIVIYLLIKNWKAGLILLVVGGLVFLVFHSHLTVIFLALIKKYSRPGIRIYTWKNVCIPLLKDHPLLGIGLASYCKVASSYCPNVLWSHAHNFFLNYLDEIGFIGGLLLFFSTGIPAVYMIKLYRRARYPLNNLSLGFALSIVGILIFGMVETVMDNFQIGLLFWSLTGMALGIYSREKMTNCKEEENGKGAT